MRTGLRSILLSVMTVVLLVGVGVGYALAAEQSVALSPSIADQPVGSSFTLSASYDVSDGDNTLTGLGVRFHFDSTKLQFTGYSDLFSTDLIASEDQPQDDGQDFDDDASTDKYVSVAWASVGGNWPNEMLPHVLVQLGFTVEAAAAEGPTSVNVSFSSNAAGYTTGSTGSVIDVFIPPGSITGTVAYTGSASATIKIGAFSDENFENFVAGTEQEAPGPFEIEEVPAGGPYYVGAFMDINGDDDPVGEPAGQADAPVTVVSGQSAAAGTVTLHHMATKIGLEANPTHISSMNPTESTLTARIMDANDYVVNSGPDSTLEVTFGVTDITYGDIKTGETNPVSATNGLASIVIVSNVDPTGGNIPCTADAEGAQAQGALTQGTVTVTTGPFSIVPEGPVVLLANETQEFNVAGGVAPYSWSVTGGGTLSKSTTQTADEKVVYTAPGSETMGITVTVTDDATVQSQATINVYEPVEIPDKPPVPPTIEPGDTSDTFTVSGGDGSYTWTVTDGSGAEVDTQTGDSYTFTAPTEGASAGPYTIIVSDGNGYEDSFEVYVTLEFTPQTKNIKGGGEFNLVLAGADAGAAISMVEFLNEDLNVIPEEEMGQYATFAPDVPIDFNSAALLTITGASVTDVKMFKLRATVSDDPDLTGSNGLNVATTGWIRVLPLVTYTGVVQEEDAGPFIADADVIFSLGGVTQGDPISTQVDGTFSTEALELVSPTVTGTEYDVAVLADDYVSRTDLTTAGWMNPETIELTPEGMSVSGQVTDGAAPIERAKVATTQDEETYLCYSESDGSYTLPLPLDVAVTLEARASAVGHTAAIQDILIDPDFILMSLESGDEVGTAGGTLTSGECVVDIPEGALDGAAEIELHCGIDVGTESLYTQNSVVLVEINIIGANIDEGTPIQVTMPFDTSDVNPGDFRAGNAMIYYAETADDLRNGLNVTGVPTQDVVYEDHLDGRVSFLARHASVFGAGAGRRHRGSSGSDCFIGTAASGWFLK